MIAEVNRHFLAHKKEEAKSEEDSKEEEDEKQEISEETKENDADGKNEQDEIEINEKEIRNEHGIKFDHIFGGENYKKHKFDKVNKTPQQIIDEIIKLTKKFYKMGNLPKSGEFRIQDFLDEHLLEIRGFIVNGCVRYGTAFILEHCPCTQCLK